MSAEPGASEEPKQPMDVPSSAPPTGEKLPQHQEATSSEEQTNTSHVPKLPDVAHSDSQLHDETQHHTPRPAVQAEPVKSALKTESNKKKFEGQHVAKFDDVPKVADLVFQDSSPPSAAARKFLVQTKPAEKSTENTENEKSETNEGTEVEKKADEAEAPVADEDLDEDSPDFGIRLYSRGMASIKRKSQKVKEVDTKEENFTFIPQVSPHALAMKVTKPGTMNWKHFLEDQEKWVSRRKTLFGKKKDKLLAERDEPMTEEFRAKPGKQSSVLVSKMKKEGRYGGPIKAWGAHFSAFLIKRSSTPNPTERKETAVSQRRNTRSSSPAVSTPNNDRCNVFSRLYEESQTRSAAQQIVAAARIEAEQQSLFRPMTNERTRIVQEQYMQVISSQPRNRDSDSATSETEALADTLLAKYLPAMVSKQQDSEIDRVEGHGFQENVKSDPSQQCDRVFTNLLLKGEEYRQRAAARRKEREQHVDAECTFAPVTTSRSKLLLKKWSTTHMPSSTTEADETQCGGQNTRTFLRTERDALQHARQLFQHSRTQNPGQSSRNTSQLAATSTGTKFDVDVFCARVERRVLEREQRLHAEREKNFQNEAADCTFRPKLSRASLRLAQGNEPLSRVEDFPSLQSPVDGHRQARPGRINMPVRVPPAPTDRQRTENVSRALAVQRTQPLRRATQAPPAEVEELGYLDQLEKELRGVIEEWRTVEPL